MGFSVGRRAIGMAIIVGALLSSCSLGAGDSLFTPEGTQAISQRLTIEEFQREIEPKILRYVDEVALQTVSVIQHDGDSKLDACSEEGSWVLHSQMFVTGILDTEELKQLGEEILVPLGFTDITDSSEGDLVALSWFNPLTGGYVGLGASNGSTRFHYESSCLPTDGSTTQPLQFIPERPADYPQTYEPEFWSSQAQ